MTEPMTAARFFRKAAQVEDLLDKDDPFTSLSLFKVEKMIVLSPAQYRHFSTHLWENMPFITANKSLMGIDTQGVSHCLLVTARSIGGGILVESQGFDYARYAADVPDKSALDLRGVIVDHYDLKLRQPRSQQKQR